MKFFAVLAAASLAVASAQAPCDTAKLVSIATGTNGKACTGATGYTPASLSIPSGDDLKKVCSTASCNALLAEMNTAIPTECLFSGVPVKSTLLDKFPAACKAALGDAATPTTAPVATTPAPATTTAAPGATTAKPEATTAKPEATTAKPEATTAKPEATTAAPEATTAKPDEKEETEGSQKEEAGSGSTGIEEIEAPVEVSDTNTTKPSTTPVPTPTSSASTVLAAAGTVVVAVAATLF